VLVEEHVPKHLVALHFHGQNVVVDILEADPVVQRMVVEVDLYWSQALVPENE
jgi:hypothetical protein